MICPCCCRKIMPGEVIINGRCSSCAGKANPRAAEKPKARAAHGNDRMNKTEAAYAEVLEIQVKAGLIKRWRFNSMKLRLANKTWLTVDFCVTNTDNSIAWIEVKGHWEDDARAKIKVAAEQYPEYRFVAVSKIKRKDGGGWREEEF